MLSKKMLEEVLKFSQKPDVFEKGTGNIWTEPYLAEQMLKNHLDLGTDISSRSGEEINRIIEFLNQKIPESSTILDLGCGPGLYAERLCKCGHQVTGVDFSENSIRYARESAKRNDLDIEYDCNSILEMNYQKCFDVAIQIYGEVNTFSDDDRNRLFAGVQHALKPGGVFIFDVTTPHHRGEELKNSWSVNEHGFWSGRTHIVLEEEFKYDHDIWLEQYIVIDEDEVKVYRDWFHEYTKESIEAVVLAAGFGHVQVFENLYNEKKVDQSTWLTVIAKK